MATHGSEMDKTAAAVDREMASGGVAALGPAGIDDALRIADRALYRAKRSGRDQFKMAA